MERVACCARPCATCCAFSPCCLDGMRLHAGPLYRGPGRPQSPRSVIGAARQPLGGGGLRPALQVMRRDGPEDGTHE